MKTSIFQRHYLIESPKANGGAGRNLTKGWSIEHSNKLRLKNIWQKKIASIVFFFGIGMF